MPDLTYIHWWVKRPKFAESQTIAWQLPEVLSWQFQPEDGEDQD